MLPQYPPSPCDAHPVYFFSGVNTPELLAIMARRHAAAMVNALSAGQPALVQAYNAYPDVRIALDSGAFQKNTNLEGYASLMRRIGWRMEWCASLDVLHNQEASDDNYAQLRALLARDEEALDKLVYIYQCQSKGARWSRKGDLSALTRALEHHPFIAVGGIVPVLQRSLTEAIDVLGAIGEVLDAADARCHVFGIGNQTLLAFTCSQRWFRSSDSSRWLHGLSSRLLLTLDGGSLSAHNLAFSGLECAEQNVAAMLSWLRPASARQLTLFPDDDEVGCRSRRMLPMPRKKCLR
jgi:hypothetical protein